MKLSGGPILLACSLVAGAPAAAQNLLTNPDFATDIAGWTPNGSVSWSAADAGGSESSGSAQLVSSTEEGETSTSMSQCVDLSEAGDYVLSAKAFRISGQIVSGFGSVSFYEGESCGGAFLEQQNAFSLFGFGTGIWESASGTVTAPAAAASAMVVLRSRRETDGALVLHYDDAVFARDLGCVDDATSICLNDGRFRVTVDWRTKQGETGPGHAVRLTADTGYFWFFNDTNVELVVKVLDACGSPFNSFWVFAAGLTNVEVEITVLDTEKDVEQTYFNPLDSPFQPIQDTAAFLTCP